ncbi:Lsr2 family DNA-binding protein [Streptomyces chartreusis]|uniref:Lsr2 family DNA-binding protein n=1 Tax=Streptomyces chartreusis TaxID=1969 RepID=UPI003694D9C9
MAKMPVQVPEEDYKKDPGKVQRIETPIPGFPDAEPVVTYIRVQYVDDLTGIPADDVETVHLLVPVEEDREEVVRGEDGEPEKNDDGSDKLKVSRYLAYEPRELDLSQASLQKLMEALEPFAEKSRPRSERDNTRATTTRTAAHDLSAIRSWAQNAGHEVAVKGRVSSRIIDAYYKATGKPRPDENA